MIIGKKVYREYLRYESDIYAPLKLGGVNHSYITN